MDLFTVIGVILWIWGGYKGWAMLSAKNWEWVNRPDTISLNLDEILRLP